MKESMRSIKGKEVMSDMELFKYRLQQLVAEAILLEIEFERMNATDSDLLAMKYPFEQSFNEVVYKLLEWRYSI